jgi:prolyl-tRNA synthetase
LAKGEIEVKVRQTGEMFTCPMEELESRLDAIIAELTPELEGLPYLPEA